MNIKSINLAMVSWMHIYNMRFISPIAQRSNNSLHLKYLPQSDLDLPEIPYQSLGSECHHPLAENLDSACHPGPKFCCEHWLLNCFCSSNPLEDDRALWLDCLGFCSHCINLRQSFKPDFKCLTHQQRYSTPHPHIELGGYPQSYDWHKLMHLARAQQIVDYEEFSCIECANSVIHTSLKA